MPLHDDASMERGFLPTFEAPKWPFLMNYESVLVLSRLSKIVWKVSKQMVQFTAFVVLVVHAEFWFQ